MAKKRKKKSQLSKFEVLLYTFTAILVVLSPFAVVYSQAALSEVNFDVEKLKKEITTQEKKNQGLTMKINELASLDKIQEVAEEKGLSYNNSNIKSIDSKE